VDLPAQRPDAGIGLSLAVIPIVYTVSEDAFGSVPQTYREGSIAMGASSWQTAWRVVLPAAMPGVLASCILGFGRAIGETMIVLMASGNAAVISLSPRDSVRTFSATIAAELGRWSSGARTTRAFLCGRCALRADLHPQPAGPQMGGEAPEEAPGGGLAAMRNASRSSEVFFNHSRRWHA